MIGWLRSIAALQTPTQWGFLLSILLAFALGWTLKALHEDRRRRLWRQAFWRGVRLQVWR